MKRSTRSTPMAAFLPLALLFAAANAQTSTVINDPADTDATTVYYSVCPTALTTTTTLSSTLTVCPGTGCAGGGGIITAPPSGPTGTQILSYTTTLPDGSVEVINEYVTIYPAICSGGSSIGQATYTITEACPCEATKNPASIPSGFTTTVTSCDVCHNGGPTTMTMTVPCTTGPYATVTPIIGPTGAGANAQAAASAGANAAANAEAGSGGSGSSSSGSGSGSSNSGSSSGGPNGGSNANANAGANANANANAEAGSSGNNGGSSANSASSGNSAAQANSAGGGSNAAANAGANAAASAAAGANSGAKWDNGTSISNNTISPPISSVLSGAASGAGSAATSQFTGSADRVGFAVSGVLAVVAGCLAFVL